MLFAFLLQSVDNISCREFHGEELHPSGSLCFSNHLYFHRTYTLVAVHDVILGAGSFVEESVVRGICVSDAEYVTEFVCRYVHEAVSAVFTAQVEMNVAGVPSRPVDHERLGVEGASEQSPAPAPPAAHYI